VGSQYQDCAKICQFCCAAVSALQLYTPNNKKVHGKRAHLNAVSIFISLTPTNEAVKHNYLAAAREGGRER
jgi:hypothetical protein